jgi:signal peptidase I
MVNFIMISYRKVKACQKMKKNNKTIFGVVIMISIMFFGCSKSYVPMKIEGKAMLPSFKDGDRVLVEENVSEIKRGDVIFFQYPKNTTKLFFKRVVGLPNETVSILNGKVFINDKELEEPYLDRTYNQAKSNLPPVKVPDQSYFVLGDNRDNSSDSRYWGTVKKELIIGKYCLIY